MVRILTLPHDSKIKPWTLVLIGEINGWTFSILDEQVGARETPLLSAGLEVRKAWIWGLLLFRIKIFELPLTFVEIPELLLGAVTYQGTLGLEIIKFFIIVFTVDLLSV